MHNIVDELLDYQNHVNIVYTWWTKPQVNSEYDTRKIDKILPLFCLSIASFKQFYPFVHVVTDSLGEKILKSLDLGIIIHNELDNFNIDPELWSAAKYVTYEKFIGSKFIHVDMDVVISRPIISRSKYLFFSNESGIGDKNTWEFVAMVHGRVKETADVLGLRHHVPEKISSYNVGIFRMDDEKILRSYIDYGKDFLQKASDNLYAIQHLPHDSAGLMLILCEQKVIENFVPPEEIDTIHGPEYEYRSFVQSNSDKYFTRKYVESGGKDFKYLFNKVFAQNLLNIGSTGLIHYCSSIKVHEDILPLTDFYLQYYFPTISNKLKNADNY